jgi:septum formation protein
VTIWCERQPLILASQSVVRKNLLVNAGITVETIPADIDERGIQQGSGLTDPGQIAALLAGEKAKFISAKSPGRYVVGADQTLALEDRLFSKPENLAAAAAQIKTLSGQTHALHSAVSVAKDGAMLFSHVSVARMTMRFLTDSEIEAYITEAGDALMSSVGAYQLERMGVHLFERINGDHFTILGLPLLPLLGFLRSRNLLAV